MTDVSAWSTTDSSNNSAPPAGAPEGMNPSAVDDTMRAIFGGVRRSWERTNAVITTTGASGIYTYTPTNASFPAAYVNGETYTFRAHQDSAGNDVLNVNALGAKNLYLFANTGVIPIQAHQIKNGMIVQAMYDSTLNSSAGGFQVLAAIPRSLNPGDNTGSWTAGSVVFAFGNNSLTQDNANFFWDSTNHRLGIKTASPLSSSAMTVAGSISITAADGNLAAGGNRAMIDLSAAKARVGSISGGGTATTTSIMAGTNQEVLQVTSTGLSINGGLPAFALDVTGDGNVTGGLKFSTNNFAIRSGNYHVIYDNAGNQSIFLGNVSDATNYYRNTVHTFQSISGTTSLVQIGLGGLSILTGNVNITSGNYLIGGSQIAHPNLSDYTAPASWTPADASGASLTLTVTDAKYIKLGKLIVVSAYITYPTNSDSSLAKIGGLPATAASGTNPTGGGASSMAGSSASGLNSSDIFFGIAPGGNIISSLRGNVWNTFQNVDLSGRTFGFTISYLSA